MTGVELKSSVTMDGISGLLPLPILERVKIREKDGQEEGLLEFREREVGERGRGEVREDMRMSFLSVLYSQGEVSNLDGSFWLEMTRCSPARMSVSPAPTLTRIT